MRASPRQYLLASGWACGSALLRGWLAHVPFCWFWRAGVYGYAVGEATLRGGGRKRGLGMQVIAGVAAAVGSLAWAGGYGPMPLRALPEPGMLLGVGLGRLVLVHLMNPFALVGLGIGVGSAVWHVRYI